MIRRPIVTSPCTCVTSLVLRVMRLAVPNLSYSLLVKLGTFAKISRRRSRAMPAPMRLPQKPTLMAHTASRRAISSILPPVRKI